MNDVSLPHSTNYIRKMNVIKNQDSLAMRYSVTSKGILRMN
jgi:hypothetical protein